MVTAGDCPRSPLTAAMALWRLPGPAVKVTVPRPRLKMALMADCKLVLLSADTETVAAALPPTVRIVAPTDGAEVSSKEVTVQYEVRSASGDPVTGVRLPLKVGAKWETHFTASRKNPDRDSTVDATSVVTDYEEVSFRFGLTYDAFKIETNETVTAVGGGPSATLKVTLWYAPAVNRYVKRVIESRTNDRLQSRIVEALTDYKRRHED